MFKPVVRFFVLGNIQNSAQQGPEKPDLAGCARSRELQEQSPEASSRLDFLQLFDKAIGSG